MTLSIEVYTAHRSWCVVIGDNNKRTVLGGLRSQATLGSRWIIIAPVSAKLESEVDKDEAGNKDLERGPRL
jgi:hypothetical protein